MKSDPPATLRTALSAGSSCSMERGWSLCHASSSARSICILPPKRHHQARLTTRSLTTLIRWKSTSRLATRSLTTTTSGACCHRTTLTSCSPTQPSPPQPSVTQRQFQSGSQDADLRDDKDLGVVGVCPRLSQPLSGGCRRFPGGCRPMPRSRLSSDFPARARLSQRCSQTLSPEEEEEAPARTGFSVQLHNAARKATKRDAAHPCSD